MRMQDLTKLFVNTINGLSGVVNFPILDASIGKGTHSSGTAVIIGRLDDQTASGNYSLAVGRGNNVSAAGDVALGRDNTVSGSYSAAIGYGNTVTGSGALAAGNTNYATGNGAMAFGIYNRANAQSTLAEGQGSQANYQVSHAEGYYTEANEFCTHSEGWKSKANGRYSHVEGLESKATRRSQHVFGEYNAEDSSQAEVYEKGDYVEIVGNGTADDARSNARTLDWNGNEVLAGKLTLGADPVNAMDAATKQYVDNAIPVEFKAFSVAANATATITLTPNSGAVIFTSGYQAARQGIIDIGSGAQGTAFQSKVNASSVTVSASGSTVTITSANELKCLMIVYAGSATVS